MVKGITRKNVLKPRFTQIKKLNPRFTLINMIRMIKKLEPQIYPD